jgi:hypothetical protein
MRLWSLHPSYLDAKGLIAVWREGLLALAVLQGKTKGYTRHPQLHRFQSQPDPIKAMYCYLQEIYDESEKRGYLFNETKIVRQAQCTKIAVTTGQLHHEVCHLQNKLHTRDSKKYTALKNIYKPKPHPLFKLRKGSVATWEKI